MADTNNKYEDNVSGGWYVDKECIDCDLCNDMAPNNFKSSDADDHSIVYLQPENEDETIQCQEALEACPVEAIGKDG